MTRDDLPKISKDDASWLSDNPNTSDVVEWVQDYALQCIAALRAPAVTGAALDGPRLKTSLDAQYERALDVINRQREEIERLKAAPPAAGAPPALVALVERLQTAMRSFKGWTQAGMPRTADHFEDKARAALDDVLAWSPAPAPVAPPAETRCGEQCLDPYGQDDHCRCAPPAVAGGDAPEIQVGDDVTANSFPDVYNVSDSDLATYWNTLQRERVDSIKRVIWRRRHQSR